MCTDVSSSIPMETRRRCPPEMPRMPCPPTSVPAQPSSPSASSTFSTRAARRSGVPCSCRSAMKRKVSRTVSVGMSVSSCATYALIWRISFRVTVWPFSASVPETVPTVLRPASVSRNDDLPAPEGPITASSSPAWITPVAPCTTVLVSSVLPPTALDPLRRGTDTRRSSNASVENCPRPALRARSSSSKQMDAVAARWAERCSSSASVSCAAPCAAAPCAAAPCATAPCAAAPCAPPRRPPPPPPLSTSSASSTKPREPSPIAGLVDMLESSIDPPAGAACATRPARSSSAIFAKF